MKKNKNKPQVTNSESLNPVNRDLLNQLIALQRRRLGKIATLLAGSGTPDYLPQEWRALPEKIGGTFESNIEQLSHGLSARYDDGELESPVRESLSELVGVAGGIATSSTEHPLIGLFSTLHISLQEVITACLVLHSAAVSAHNGLLAEMTLRHLERLHSLSDLVATAIPVVTVAELSHLEPGFSGRVTGPATNHAIHVLQPEKKG
ncbi:MAG: hypothetical protein ACI8XO_003025 [Verrucomicrobiales bacterium]|jgi:hypothetical protein